MRITRENINDYRHTVHYITKIIWSAGPLDAGVLANLPNLQTLRCSSNGLTSLAGLEACPQLLELDCSDNHLSDLSEISNCNHLRVLKCSRNRLSTLTGLAAPQLRILDCSSNRLESLMGVNSCLDLRKLNCSNNLLNTLHGLVDLKQLRSLVCSGNQLLTLEGLDNPLLTALTCAGAQLESLSLLTNCPRLLVLECGNNNLRSLVGISMCPLLKSISCGVNELTTLQELNHCPQLHSLDCGSNHLENLASITGCPLRKLYCRFNQIVSLAGIERFPQLQVLDCYSNKLQSLAGVENCPQLRMLDCRYNRFELGDQGNYLDPLVDLANLRAHMNLGSRETWRGAHGRNVPKPDPIYGPRRLRNRRFWNYRPQYRNSWVTFTYNRAVRGPHVTIRKPASIYQNKQNVHDAYVHKSVTESISNLLQDPEPTFETSMIGDSQLSAHTIRLLYRFCEDSIAHSVHGITYTKLLSYVWSRIVRSLHKLEMFRIPEEQVAEADDKCSTGRFNRTLSVLVGFYDDIVIEISDSSRIGGIIVAASKLEPYDPIAHRKRAEVLLLEAGYAADTIEPWLRAISEP